MEPTWVLVADGARARVFSVERPRGPLQEEADWVHPEERLPERELVTDSPGRGRGAGGPQHAVGGEDVKRSTEATRFAKEIAQELKKAREQGRFQRLYLAAEPHFLGVLRRTLDEHTAATIVESYDKDWVRHSAQGIRELLPERL